MPTGGHRGRVAVGGAWSLLSWGVSFAAGPLVLVLVVRSVSHRQYGSLSVAISLAAILGELICLGLSAAVVQVAVTERTHRGDGREVGVLKGAMRLAAVSALVGVTLSAIGTASLYAVPSLRSSALPFIALIPVVLLGPFAAVARGAVRILYWPRIAAAAAIIASVASAAITLMVIAMGHASAVTVAVARSAASVLGLIALAWPLLHWHRGVDRKARLDGVTRRLLVFGLPALVGIVFVLVTSQFTILLLGSFHGSQIVGLYSPAAAVAIAVMGLPSVIGNFYLPSATDLAVRGDLVGVAGLYHWTTRWSITLASPAIAVLLICPAAVLDFVFGPAFGRMSGVLRILAIGVTVQVVSGFNGLTLDAFGLPKVAAARQGIGLGLGVLACVTLIPIFGATGAAFASSGAIVTANVLCSVVLAHRFRIWPWDRAVSGTVVVLTASMALSAGVIISVHSHFWCCMVVGATSAVTTGAASVTFGGRADRHAIADRLRRRVQPAAPLTTLN